MNDEQPAADIELLQVTRRFGRTAAVDGLSFTIPAGTTCGFIGLNGAGKTTTIRMIVGLLRPHGGIVQVAGCDVPAQRQRLKFRIGYVPDRPTVYGWMRVRDALGFCRSVYGRRWNHEGCDALRKSLRLDANARVRDLSKGAAAKLSLLLAMGHDPDVLILDEPTSGFDPLARDEFLEGLLSASESPGRTERPRRRTVLFSSHTLADVQRLADQVALIHKGRLLLHQSLDDVLGSNKRIRAVLEDRTGDGERHANVPPPGMVYQQVRGREWLLTVKDFSGAQLEFVRAKNRVGQVDVIDLTLDDVFRDYVRGADEVMP